MSDLRAKARGGEARFSKFTTVGLSSAVVDIGVLNLFLWFQPTRGRTCLRSTTASRSSWRTSTATSGTRRGPSGGGRTTASARAYCSGCRRWCTSPSAWGFWAFIHPLVVDTDIPTYLVGDVAKIISVVVASVISLFIVRYVVFSRKRWLEGRL